MRDTILYWKAYIRRNRGGIVDVEVMNKRKEMHQIMASGEGLIEEASQKLQLILKEWEELKINKKKHREEYLLDYHHTNRNKEGAEKVQNKKKIINSI